MRHKVDEIRVKQSDRVATARYLARGRLAAPPGFVEQVNRGHTNQIEARQITSSFEASSCPRTPTDASGTPSMREGSQKFSEQILTGALDQVSTLKEHAAWHYRAVHAARAAMANARLVQAHGNKRSRPKAPPGQTFGAVISAPNLLPKSPC